MADRVAAAEARMAARRIRIGEEGSKLLSYEARWRDKQPFLASRGYSLRPRFHPGWKPSWELQPDSDPRDYEDYWKLPVCSRLIFMLAHA